MEPALDVVNRALQGDVGARSFLERTTSIYVLDVTDASKPKTYGCWNFVDQAMNEIERYETRDLSGITLSYHVRMIASMALKVARRGPTADKALIITCTSNASQYNGSVDQSQWLVDLNVELREIVMGRIAAMAFDFTFHQRTWLNGRSAFADHVSLDTFCAVLSANAVSNGPTAVWTFATEWIIPSSTSLPTFSVIAVVLHLALEGMRKAAPVGTKDTLQQLSYPIMSIVLVPILADSLTMNVTTNATSMRDENLQIAAMALRAMKVWCDSTDLSLPLIKHICSKIKVDVVEVLSDAMYSDSTLVVDALAEFVENTAIVSDEKIMSDGRMSQVRHIIQPDVASFQTQVTGQQLKIIESREMLAIVDDLMSAIGLQRFRFVDRQNKGDFDVCRNLARIAASVCDTWMDSIKYANPVQPSLPEGGAVALLIKGANHPSVNICAICLKPLTRLMPLVPALPLDLLPVLQRQAIIPHHLRGGKIDLDAVDLCGVTLQDIQIFRLTVLSDTLFACWTKNGEHYMDSCTSAIEEFCCTTSSIDVSLQAEAALFCIERISWDTSEELQETFPANNVMRRLVKALLFKPPSVMSNPLTRESMCRFICKYSRWFSVNRELDVAMDLILASFHAAHIPATIFTRINDLFEDTAISCVHETSLALKAILLSDPIALDHSSTLPSVLGLWEALYNSSAQGSTVYYDDRIAVGTAIGQFVYHLSADVRIHVYDAMMKFPLEHLEHWVQNGHRTTSRDEHLSSMKKLGDEITVVAHLLRVIAYPFDQTSKGDMTESGNAGSEIPETTLSIFRKAWPYVEIAASKWGDDDNVSRGLSVFLVEVLPPFCERDNHIKLITELCELAVSMLQRPRTAGKYNFNAVIGFMGTLLVRYGNVLGQTSDHMMEAPKYGRDMENIVTSMVWKLIKVEQEYFGLAWTYPIKGSEQGNGQSASESKTMPIQKSPQKKSNMESVSGVLSVLTQGLMSCPVFTMSLPANAPTTDHGVTTIDDDDDDHDDDDTNNRGDLLIRRAAGTASVSLEEHQDTEMVQSAVVFLLALIRCLKHWPAAKEFNGSYVEEPQWMTYLYPELVGKLLIGICGKYDYTVLDHVTELLVLLVQRMSASMTENGTTKRSWIEMEWYMFAPIRSQYDQIFLFGEPARHRTQRALLQYAAAAAAGPTVGSKVDDGNGSATIMSDALLLIQTVWHLHQMDDPIALPGSDGVHQFIAKYGRP